MIDQDELPPPASGNFPIPERALRDTQRKDCLLEYPPGSGRQAFYTVAEQAFVMGFVYAGLRHEKGTEERKLAALELENLHDLKVEFGIDLTVEQEPEDDAPHND